MTKAVFWDSLMVLKRSPDLAGEGARAELTVKRLVPQGGSQQTGCSSCVGSLQSLSSPVAFIFKVEQ